MLELAQDMQEPFYGGPGSFSISEMEEYDSVNGRCHHPLVFTEVFPPLLHVSQSR